MKWPVEPGRYKLGNANAPVAVCTMASLDIELPMDNIAIVGKTVTENIGIEKVVRNIISNPNIRFLICCGKISKGHFVGDALECLVKNGVDENKRIIGAKGAIPVVKNLSQKEIEHFRKQVKVICMQGEEDVEKIMEKVKECVINNPGPFKPTEYTKLQERKEVNEIEAWHKDEKDVKLEPNYFEIKLDRKNEKIIAECYTGSHELKCRIIGKRAEDITHTIIRKGLIHDLGHAAYLGRELQKAEIALKNNLDFVQDEELRLEPLSSSKTNV